MSSSLFNLVLSVFMHSPSKASKIWVLDSRLLVKTHLNASILVNPSISESMRKYPSGVRVVHAVSLLPTVFCMFLARHHTLCTNATMPVRWWSFNLTNHILQGAFPWRVHSLLSLFCLGFYTFVRLSRKCVTLLPVSVGCCVDARCGLKIWCGLALPKIGLSVSGDVEQA